MKILIGSLFVLLSLAAKPQDFKCDLKNSFTILSESKFELNIVTNTFLNDVHLEEESFYVYQSAKNRKTVSNETEELVNENYIVQINKIEKEIYVIDIQVQEVKGFLNDFQLGKLNFQDSVWNKQMGKTKVNFELMTEQKKYSYTVKNDLFFREIDYFINRSTNLIERIVYHYKQDGTLSIDKAVIDFQFDLGYDFDSDFFSEEQYFTIDTKSKFVLNGNYDNFVILK